jgi:hypothetical protein
MRDERRDGQWLWWKFRLNDTEARVLEAATGTMSDAPLPESTRRTPGGKRKDNIFCAGAAHLPDGNLLVVGGHMALREYRGVPIAEANDNVTDNANHIHVYDGTKARLAQARPHPETQPVVSGSDRAAG